MAHTTLLSRTGCETKIYFNLRGTGITTLAHNYFGSYQFYAVSSVTKRSIQRLIYSSNHVNGVDVYGDSAYSAYRYNGTPTESQQLANNALKALLIELETTQESFTEAEIHERQATSTPTAEASTPTTEATTASSTTASACSEEHWLTEDEILRHIRTRDRYHRGFTTTASTRGIVASGLAKIPQVNGVKTSFACEWEMGYMNNAMQEQWAKFLYDNNVVVDFENDSTVNGGEYPTEPMETERFIRVMKLWQSHIAETHNDMASTGAHITMGKSDATVSESDLKIRLARYGMLLNSITTIEDRKMLFGRDFESYARNIGSISTAAVTHGAIFSIDGRVKAFEFRLPNYKMDVRATVNILNEIGSVVFYHRPTTADYHRFIDLVASETARLRNEHGDPV